MTRRSLGSASVSILPVFLFAHPRAAEKATSSLPKTAPAKPTPTAKPWTPSRTPDGKPDLQGIWNTATVTPLERPKALGAKEFYTDEEFSKLSQRIRQGEAGEERALGAAGEHDLHYDI